MSFNNYNDPYQVRGYINAGVVPMVYEVLVDSYGINDEDYNGDIYDNVHEVIDSLEDVIYNYQAKKVAEAFGMSAFDEAEITGERFNSYNEMAYELIYTKFMDKYAEQLEDLI